MFAIRSLTLPNPPMGWKMPYSYSRKANMVNRLGQLNGDMPRYFVWKDMASMRRSSSKSFIRSPATERWGRTPATRMARLDKRSVGPYQGS